MRVTHAAVGIASSFDAAAGLWCRTDVVCRNFSAVQTSQLRCSSSFHRGRSSQTTSSSSLHEPSSHASSSCGIGPRGKQPTAQQIVSAKDSRIPTTSNCIRCSHTSDRATRRRQLTNTLHAAQAFRKWCDMQARRTHAAVMGAVSASAASQSGARATTLADIVSEENVCRGIARHRVDIGPLRMSNAKESLGSSGDIPSTERRMLEHYADLLHTVRTAAARVATSDFQGLYAAQVQELLTAPAFPGGGGAFRVPRSVMWQDASAAPHSEGIAEDPTVQAERRLAEWTTCWFKELKEWHSRHSARISDGKDTVAALDTLPREEVWEDAIDSEEKMVGSRGEDPSLAAQLLQGQWRAVMESLLDVEANKPLHTSPTPGAPHGRSPKATRRLSAAELFSPKSVRRRHRVFWRPQPHRGSENKARPTAPPLPRRLALAAVTPTELRLLQYPPSPGLCVLSPPVTVKQQRVESREKGAGAGGITEPLLLLTEAAAAEVAAGRATGIPPMCVVRLRRRLWVLQHLPRHLPASLIRFLEVPSGSMPHVYLLRSHALERLPWYTLCVLGEALEKGGGNDELPLAAVLHNARTHIYAALFLTVPADYAALHDYVYTLFRTLGNNMVAHAVAARQRGQQQKAACVDRNEMVRSMERIFAQTAIALLRPPSPEAYTAAGLSSRLTWAPENMTHLLAERSPALTPSASTDVPDVHVVSRRLFDCLCAAVQSWRNYHLSLYCETLSQIADGDGVALCELADILSAHRLPSPTGNDPDAMQEEGVVVLAPESAAAIMTALLLQRLDQLSRSSTSSLSAAASASPPSPTLPRALYFSAPHDKEHAVASYFRGIFHSSFFRRVVVTTTNATAELEEEQQGMAERTAPATPQTNRAGGSLRGECVGAAATTPTPTESPRTAGREPSGAWAPPALVLRPAEWERNAAARLIGRTLRRLDRYPTRTTEAFFARCVRGDDADPKKDGEEESTVAGATAGQSASVTGVPPLAMNFFVVDLDAAAAHWHERRNSTTLQAPLTASSRPHQERQLPLPAQPLVEVAAAGSGTAASSNANKPISAHAITLLASPPMLPHGLHAVYKPAGVNCTLHAHYPSLVYPLLTSQLPWGTNRAAEGRDEHRDAGPMSPPRCVPVLRQQGLVNRIDVGTSGVVLVARTASELHGAADAMIREHNMRKTYRALVQRWPPFSSSCKASTPPGSNDREAASTPLFSASPFLSPMTSVVVSGPVYAAGATAASLRRCPAAQLRHGLQPLSCSQRSQDELPVSGIPSMRLQPSSVIPPSSASLRQVYEPYATLHAALQDQRHAITRYRVLEYFASVGVAYVEVELHSGRRHQIRQHFAQLGFPLVGDARYHAGVILGHAGTTFGMQRAALHAYTIDILAPADVDSQGGDEGVPGRVVVQAALPVDMTRALVTLRKAEKNNSRR